MDHILPESVLNAEVQENVPAQPTILFDVVNSKYSSFLKEVKRMLRKNIKGFLKSLFQIPPSLANFHNLN